MEEFEISRKFLELTSDYVAQTGREPNSIYLGETEFETLLKENNVLKERVKPIKEQNVFGRVGEFAGMRAYLIANENHMSLGYSIN